MLVTYAHAEASYPQESITPMRRPRGRNSCDASVRRWIEGEPFDLSVRPWPNLGDDFYSPVCPSCKRVLRLQSMSEHAYAIRLLGRYASGEMFRHSGEGGPGVVWVGADQDYELFGSYGEAEDMRGVLVKLGLIAATARVVEVGKDGTSALVLDREFWAGQILANGSVEITGAGAPGELAALPAPDGLFYLPCKCCGGVLLVEDPALFVACPSCVQ